MKSLLRIAALAAVLSTAALAPSAVAAVRVEAPGKVAAPAAVRFSATASPGSSVTFLVDGRKVWHARAGAHGLRRHGALRLGIGRHALEVRGRRGSRVSVNRRVTRVVRPPATAGDGAPSPTAGSDTGETGADLAGGSSPSGTRPSQGGAKSGGTGTKPSGGGSTPGTTSPGTTSPGGTIPGTTTPGTTESGGDSGSTGGDEGTVTPPSEPTGSALFSSTRVGAFAVNHSAPGAVREVPDPLGSGQQVISMTVNDRDVYPITPTENPRAELISGPEIFAGDEIWLHTRILVPSDYPTVPAGGWVSLLSFYGAPFNGPSPVRLEISGNDLIWQRNGTYDWDVPFRTPLVKGKWIDVVLHERFASDGFVELWIDGQQVTFFNAGGYNPARRAATTRLEMATMDASNNAGGNSAKIMQYRQAGMFETGTIYFSGLQLGASRAAVGA